MYSFSARSMKNLDGVHPQLVKVVLRAMSMQIMDFAVHEGVRTIERQKQLVAEGKSRTMRSKHLIQNTGYGHAVDLYPSPIKMTMVNKGDAREISRFGVLSGIILTCALMEGVRLINGMDWDGDGQTLDHTFFDAPHFELIAISQGRK
jgi:peptidoglycan L-alanyl-D-glutamate endopeptidase CwlK